MRRRDLLAMAAAALLLGMAPSAHATQFQYQANLDGSSESPPNASPGTGFTEVD